MKKSKTERETKACRGKWKKTKAKKSAKEGGTKEHR